MVFNWPIKSLLVIATFGCLVDSAPFYISYLGGVPGGLITYFPQNQLPNNIYRYTPQYVEFPVNSFVKGICKNNDGEQVPCANVHAVIDGSVDALPADEELESVQVEEIAPTAAEEQARLLEEVVDAGQETPTVEESPKTGADNTEVAIAKDDLEDEEDTDAGVQEVVTIAEAQEEPMEDVAQETAGTTEQIMAVTEQATEVAEQEAEAAENEQVADVTEQEGRAIPLQTTEMGKDVQMVTEVADDSTTESPEIDVASQTSVTERSDLPKEASLAVEVTESAKEESEMSVVAEDNTDTTASPSDMADMADLTTDNAEVSEAEELSETTQMADMDETATEAEETKMTEAPVDDAEEPAEAPQASETVAEEDDVAGSGDGEGRADDISGTASTELTQEATEGVASDEEATDVTEAEKLVEEAAETTKDGVQVEMTTMSFEAKEEFDMESETTTELGTV